MGKPKGRVLAWKQSWDYKGQTAHTPSHSCVFVNSSITGRIFFSPSLTLCTHSRTPSRIVLSSCLCLSLRIWDSPVFWVREEHCLWMCLRLFCDDVEQLTPCLMIMMTVMDRAGLNWRARWRAFSVRNFQMPIRKSRTILCNWLSESHARRGYQHAAILLTHHHHCPFTSLYFTSPMFAFWCFVSPSAAFVYHIHPPMLMYLLSHWLMCADITETV